MLSQHESDAFDPGGIGRTPSQYFGMIGKMVVNRPPLVGIHWRQCLGLAGSDDRCRHLVRLFQEPMLSGGSVVVNIDSNPGGFRQAGLHDAVEQILQVVEALPSVPDEGLGFFRENLQALQTALFIDLHPDDKSKVAQHGIEDFLGSFDRFHSEVLMNHRAVPDLPMVANSVRDAKRFVNDPV